MDVQDLYESLSNISEQQYTNTSRMYWHGSKIDDLHRLKAFAILNESVPLAWVTNSIIYAERYVFNKEEGAIYLLRQTDKLNIWNPRAEKDWNDLIINFPEYSVENARKVLIDYDWVSLYRRTSKLRNIRRNDILEAIQSLDYDGVFNRETDASYPALGIFPKSTDIFGILDKFQWNAELGLWVGNGPSPRAYDPRLQKITVLKENDSNISTDIDNNERQKFLDGYI